MSVNTDLDGIVDSLNHQLPELDEAYYQVVVDEYKRLKAAKDGGGTWHRFSTYTLNQLIPELINTPEEQNTILERLGLKPDLRRRYQDYKTLPINEILEDVYNPTVTRSVRQTLKIFNQLVKDYGKENIDYVTIEMPRDKNSDEARKAITKLQKLNQNRKEDSHTFFLEQSGWDKYKFEAALERPSFARKLYFYYEQNGCCAYSGDPISAQALLSDEVEIDHIIPLSLSLDDSMNNKVLVWRQMNQDKGQRTPYQHLTKSSDAPRSFEDFKDWVVNNPHYIKNRYKRQNLLLTEDILHPKVQQRFLSRNLNDTRYASRVVLNNIQSFFYQSGTKIKVINGSFTYTLRKKWGSFLQKDRQTYHHHAVDATLCAVSPFVKVTPFEYYYDEAEDKHYMVDLDTGELIPYHVYKTMPMYHQKTYVPKWDNFKEQLYPSNLYPKIKFRHLVDKKVNRKIADATIYGTRRIETEMKSGKVKVEDYVLGKTADIHTYEGYQQFMKKQDKLLMKEHDPKTYEKLLSIVRDYPDTVEVLDKNGKTKTQDVSPFKLYAKINGLSGVQKYSKKGNGPIIRTVKYYDHRLGSHINVTKDQCGNQIEETHNDRKVVLLSTNPWRTDVYYNAELNIYRLAGLRYADFTHEGGKYQISEETYTGILEKEGIEPTDIFCFSLYKNDRIRLTKGEEILEVLYQSRNISNRNYFNAKPVDKVTWEANEAIPVYGNVNGSGKLSRGLTPGIKIEKLEVDLIGNTYPVAFSEHPVIFASSHLN